MSRRRLTAAALAVAAGLGASVASPAHAAGSVAVKMEYVGSGQIAFACQAIGAYGPSNDRLARFTRVSCSVDGVPHAVSRNGSWHAHALGTTTVVPGTSVEFCIFGSAVYGLSLYGEISMCKNVVVQSGGAVVYG